MLLYTMEVSSGTNTEQTGIQAIQKADMKKEAYERFGGWHTKQQYSPAIAAECRKCIKRTILLRFAI